MASLATHAFQAKLMLEVAAYLNHDRLQSAHNVLEGALTTALLLSHGICIHNDHRAPQAVQAIKEQQTPIFRRLNILLHGHRACLWVLWLVAGTDINRWLRWDRSEKLHDALDTSQEDSMCREGGKVSQLSARSAAGAQSPEAARKAACEAQSCPALSALLWHLQTPAARCAAPRPAAQAAQAYGGGKVRMMLITVCTAHMLQPSLSSYKLLRPLQPGAKASEGC